MIIEIFPKNSWYRTIQIGIIERFVEYLRIHDQSSTKNQPNTED